MAKTVVANIPDAIIQAVPSLVNFPTNKYWVDYDREADVLYISFERPQAATDTRETEDGVLLRYRDRELVGVTVLDASTRQATATSS